MTRRVTHAISDVGDVAAPPVVMATRLDGYVLTHHLPRVLRNDGISMP
jgi:hypothetical protein